MSIVLVEVDGMERLVQRLGPDAAERLVPPIGQTLTRQARAADHVARIGLSRFAVLLPETDEIQAINYVERVRSECDRWLAAGAVATRLAIGWACPTPGGDLRTATRIAEDRLNDDRRRAFQRAELELDMEPPIGSGPTPQPVEMPGPRRRGAHAARRRRVESGPPRRPIGSASVRDQPCGRQPCGPQRFLPRTANRWAFHSDGPPSGDAELPCQPQTQVTV